MRILHMQIPVYADSVYADSNLCRFSNYLCRSAYIRRFLCISVWFWDLHMFKGTMISSVTTTDSRQSDWSKHQPDFKRETCSRRTWTERLLNRSYSKLWTARLRNCVFEGDCRTLALSEHTLTRKHSHHSLSLAWLIFSSSVLTGREHLSSY